LKGDGVEGYKVCYVLGVDAVSMGCRNFLLSLFGVSVCVSGFVFGSGCVCCSVLVGLASFLCCCKAPSMLSKGTFYVVESD